MDETPSYYEPDAPHKDVNSDLQLWALSGIDIRSHVSPRGWSIVRVQLTHSSRAKVTNVGVAPGALDAAFIAASQILGISPTLLTYNVHSVAPGEGGSLSIRVEVELELDGRSYCGTSLGADLVRCSLSAWLEAAAKSSPRIGHGGPHKARPFQISGVDENGDLWIFASDDEGAAQAIADEFSSEGYSDLRSCRPPGGEI